MRTLRTTKTFKRDLKRCRRRGLDLALMNEVVNLLQQDRPLPARCRPHRLGGNYAGYWECHVSPDWLLIYDLEDPDELGLVSCGSHADLFG